MKTLIPLLTALLCNCAAMADVARPVLQSSTTKALVDDLATGAKKIKVSSTGTLEWVNGGTLTGASYFRAAAGLGNVENTALSTFTGSSNIVTLGTITTGTWHGSAVGIAYGGTGATTAAAARTALGLGSLAVQSDAGVAISGGSITGLAVFSILNSGSGAHDFQINHNGTLTASHTLTFNLNNSERTISLTGNLTVPSDATVSGTNTGDQTNVSGTAAGLSATLAVASGGTGQTTLQASINALMAASGALSQGDVFYFNGTNVVRLAAGTNGQYLKTQGAGANPIWGTVASGLTIGSTAIASGSSSSSVRYVLVNNGGTLAEHPSFYLDNYSQTFVNGSMYFGYSVPQGIGIFAANGTYFAFSPQYAGAFTGTVQIGAVANYTVGFSSGTNATRAVFYNTFTSTTSYEGFAVDWQTEANVVHLDSAIGSGGGTARTIKIDRGGVLKITIGANTTDHAQPVKLPSYIVSGLPSASTCGAGSMAFVTDATATTAYSTVAGGGSNKVLVISDGTNWIIH